MTANAMLLCDIHLSPRAGAALEAARAPAWIIEPEGARVVAANGAGLELLALTRDGANAALDGAMPAVARLRALLSGPDALRGSAATSQKLVFWRPAGALRLSCSVAVADGTPPSLLLVTAETNDEGDGDVQAPSTKPQTDDAATLKEIARRIRAGRKEAGPAAPAPPPPDVTEPSGEDLRSDVGKNAAQTATPSPSSSGDPLLISKLAHELKTPLAAIAAAAEVMRDERIRRARE